MKITTFRNLGITKLFKEFYESEKTAGILLIICTAISMILANSAFGPEYLNFWQYKIGFTTDAVKLYYPVYYWINDGLMAIFFLLIGLEIEREVYIGELSNFNVALFPIIAAAGGIIVPSLIHLSFNFGTDTQSGMAIPMATDIAFALGILSLLGDKIPFRIKVFLTALAIVDDLGAIIIIAVFYSKGFSLFYFGMAVVVFLILLLMNRKKVNLLYLYLIPGVFMWYFMLKSGVHATIAGVVLAFVIPFGKGDKDSISYKLQHGLHKPVAFLILPLFALANTGIVFENDWYSGLLSMNSLGIMAGLMLGKPIGIFLFSFAAVKTGIVKSTDKIVWKNIFGVGVLAGIGFTMSIFITLLAFERDSTIINSKIAILMSSLLAGTIGFFLLKMFNKK
ncbi:MAG TPA: Na+/H+ antiporter NhaA [Ignavibacteria bacterium]|nr:Na+/H+ antiporter NhaA [Ignavibacteria bacterium]HQY51348.1 Na+/H+ antiporter NhaA [Ignavibacteria bacterium]HRA99727.1 Na+/H+ antiporter NhaA [Ignavibacteria bacterium]